MQTKDLSQEKIRLIRELFPNCVTESRERERERERTVLSVDFDALRQELSGNIVEGQQERYQFTWPDKSKAKRLANTPTTMTLRPCREESVDFDNTKNLYIEGDNLEVLKILRETYLGKVKMIYIDPPYNTGNDFVYNDDFSMSTKNYSEISNENDNSGNRIFLNSSSNGRFHTDWLNMIYPRIMISKDLLTDDGVIFISIDDSEVDNLIKVCNEVFGEDNHVCNIIWEKKYSPANDAKWLSDNHDFILLYAKNKSLWHPKLLPRTKEMDGRYINKDGDPRGPWKASDMTVKSYSPLYDYPITTPSGKVVHPSEGRCWTTSKENFQKLVEDNRIWFGEKGDNIPAMKKFLSEVQGGVVPLTIWNYEEVGHTQEGRQELKKLFGGKGLFDSPKPTRLIKRILDIANLDADSIIMDFFSGSCTTAHAIMAKNAEDGGKRQFIMVQLPEHLDEKSEAHSLEYETICDIGKKRIVLAGSLFDNVDTGFRVFKCDSSNMREVFYTPEEVTRSSLDGYADVIKNDRGPEDLLIQVMLELGIELSSKIEQNDIGGHTVFSVDDGYLVACFDDSIDDSTVTELSKEMSGCMYAVFHSGSSMSDEMLSNIEQIFKTYSPQTKIRIL